MQQIRLLMSKLGLVLIAITAISVAVAVQASYSYYFIQAADAQARVPNNSVRSESIVDGQVKTQDLADDAVTSPKIKNGEVKTEDIAPGAIEPNVHIVEDRVTIGPGLSGSASANCPDGEILTGGGFSAPTEDVIIHRSFPIAPDEWFVSGFNGESEDVDIIAYALCVGPSP